MTDAPYRMVGKYRNNRINPVLYPNVIHKVATDYNDAYVLIEINISEQVAYIMHDELMYENIIFVNRTAMGQVVSGGFGGGKVQFGVNTDKKVKRVGCHNFKAMIEENKLIVNDIDTISEISTFIEVNGQYRADEGYHDDLVMPLVLFGWLTTNSYFKELSTKDINLRKIMYEKQMRAIEEELTPFGFIDDGLMEENGAQNF
jgi:hypothetical protein